MESETPDNRGMKITILFVLLISSAFASPALQMNKAFNTLLELMPFLQNENAFKEKQNNKIVSDNLAQLNEAFRLAGHDTLIKHDLFAPSYSLISENLQEGLNAFNKNKKPYAYWLLNETVTLCMECHARLPQSVSSSFQNGELTVDKSKFKNPYDIGIAYMIVRRYVDAKEQFTRTIQDNLIKKDYSKIILPLQQIMLIDLKIQQDPKGMLTLVDDYLAKKNLSYDVNRELEGWKKSLKIWKDEKAVSGGIKSEQQLKQFLKSRLEPLSEKNSFADEYKVDLLLASGLISNYFFENQETPSAPELSYWLGWIEKRLKKENFISSGDHFLKQCILKYSKHPVAVKCLNEYKESLEFDFTGSSGTSIPEEIQTELNKFDKLVRPDKKGK